MKWTAGRGLLLPRLGLNSIVAIKARSRETYIKAAFSRHEVNITGSTERQTKAAQQLVLYKLFTAEPR